MVDLNGDYIIDEKDKAIVGNSQPRVNGGMSINLRYKNLSLFTSVSFLLRRDIINKVLADNFKSFNNPMCLEMGCKEVLHWLPSGLIISGHPPMSMRTILTL